MKIFAKRETLLQNMSLMALMAGITLIISVFTTFFPILGVFIIIALPLTSTLVELYCKDRYYPIYAVATIGLCLAANFWNIGVTFYYVIPSVITGYIFGLMSKKNIAPVWSILVAGSLQFGITLSFVPLIKVMCGLDMFETFRTIFKFTDYDLFQIVIPTFLYFVSSIQIVLSYIVVSNEIQKLGFDNKTYKFRPWLYEALLGLLAALSIGLSFVYVQVSYALLVPCYYLLIYIVLDFINMKYYKEILALIAGLPIMVVVFAFVFRLMPQYAGFTLLAVWPFCVSISSLIVSLIKSNKEQKNS